MERIEIFTGEQRRRRYTPQEKAKFVAMTMQPGYSVSLVRISVYPDSDSGIIRTSVPVSSGQVNSHLA